MKKVVLTGVESSGKTVLAKSIAGHFNCPMVEEYARDYLRDMGTDYQQSDLLDILQGQFDREAAIIQTYPDLMVCDTGPIVIKVWSLFKYGSLDPKISNAVKSYKADLFILPDPEGVPFENDPLRENPNDRQKLFQIYLDELIQLDIPFIVTNGNFEERLNQVRDAIEGLQENA